MLKISFSLIISISKIEYFIFCVLKILFIEQNTPTDLSGLSSVVITPSNLRVISHDSSS